jgi:hypothetical protein
MIRSWPYATRLTRSASSSLAWVTGISLVMSLRVRTLRTFLK